MGMEGETKRVENRKEKKYTVWMCGVKVVASSPAEAGWKALDGPMMIDKVVDDETGIIEMAIDSRELHKRFRYESECVTKE